MSEQEPKQFSYGGQAVIEGVMMRGAHQAAVAARDPNGKIHIKEVALNATLYRGWVAKTPFVRGLVGLWDAMGLGTRALLWSADIALIEGTYYRINYNDQVGWVQHSPSQVEVNGNLDIVPRLEDHATATMTDAPTDVSISITSKKPIKVFATPEEKADVIGEIADGTYDVFGLITPEKEEDFFTGAAATGMIAVSLAFGIGLFFLLPTAASSGVGDALGITDTGVVNFIEEAIKFILFLGYILLIGQMEDVKRLFRYHGAEHKTINAYEAGAELTPEVVNTYPIEHPRCGTAFLLNVIIISVIVNTLIGRFDNNLLILVPVRLITVPIVAGIAYEWLRYSANHLTNPLISTMIKPNLWLQRLTTNEPDNEMCEVAIAAFERVLISEGILNEQDAKSSAYVDHRAAMAQPANAQLTS